MRHVKWSGVRNSLEEVVNVDSMCDIGSISRQIKKLDVEKKTRIIFIRTAMKLLMRLFQAYKMSGI